MSDYKREENNDILSGTSTEQLEDLIRQMPLDDIDTDYWNAVMDAYNHRANTTVDTEAALEDFKENYLGREPIFGAEESAQGADKEQTSHITVVGTRPHSRSNVRMGLVAAVVVALMLAGTVTAYAFGYDLWGAVAKWTSETFGLTYQGNPTSHQPVDPDSEVYTDLQSALIYHGITDKLVPTWLPKGFVMEELYVEEDKSYFYASYFNDTNLMIGITISSIRTGDSAVYEKSDEPVDKLYVDGVMHYIMSNNTSVTAVWMNANFECSIFGDVGRDEMEEMIQSIYEGNYK